jgi:benzoyl-CoA reductase subunit C
VHYRQQLRDLLHEVAALAGRDTTPDDLRRSISLFNENRRLLRALYDLRAEQPHVASTSEVYLLARAGNLLDVEEHSQLLRDYLAEAPRLDRRPIDSARVLLSGAFCEQPPLGLLRTIERSGCSIVDDDLVLGGRWLTHDIDPAGDPLDALAMAYLEHSVSCATRYEPDRPKGEALVELVRRRRAEGVLFAAPSFCDPALLERPMLAHALDRAGIAHTSFQYAENTGEFQGFREQAGTFSDSIKLWGGEHA